MCFTTKNKKIKENNNEKELLQFHLTAIQSFIHSKRIGNIRYIFLEEFFFVVGTFLGLGLQFQFQSRIA